MSLPFKISVLVFMNDRAGRFLMIKRAKAPNLGRWSPIGGKLDFGSGESPVECARREIGEEVGLPVADEDLRLFGYVSEKNYEGAVHWLMFLVHCRKPIEALPPAIEEGEFSFFTREQICELDTPPSDDELIWKPFDEYREGFVGVRADCRDPGCISAKIETAVGIPGR